jgi:glycosyltransferase involved in cell wall biosynthesis
LREQGCKDFLWLIVDDGSSDNTADLVREWQADYNGFEIRYIYKENGGMHTAHNTAYANIDTELNVCIDSDDALAPGAVQIICETWEKVRERGYAGLLGLDADFSGAVIGTGFPKDLTETTLDGYYRNGGKGDKKLILRTDVVREFPAYPVFEGERFVPLGTLYTMIDRRYKLYVVDEVLCLVEYMADGSTKNMLKQYLHNPQGFRYARLVTLGSSVSFKRKLALYVHYTAESILSHKFALKDAPSKLLCLAAFPAGAILVAYIKMRGK